jgi:hypothetical protein
VKRLAIPCLILLAGLVLYLVIRLRPGPPPEPDAIADFWNSWELKGSWVDAPDGKKWVQENLPGPEAPRVSRKRSAASGR